jgi:HlyD family secretion protein
MTPGCKRLSLLCIAVGAAALAWYWHSNGDGDDPLFRTEPVTRGAITEIVSATGTLNPVQLVEVGTQVSGKVSKLNVQVNDRVKAGKVLAEIDPALLLAQLKQDQAALETARASYEQAKRDLDRTRTLVAKDFVAKVELERAQQAFLSAKNSYDAAQTVVERDEVNLGYASITSPIDGTVISLEVAEGQTLQASFQAPTVLRIAGNLAEMKIDVGLSEADIPKVRAGMPVNFTVNAYPDKAFTGTVETVNLSPKSQMGGLSAVVYPITVSVRNQDELLRPGMTAYVNITLSEQKDVLRVPVAALRFTPPPGRISGLRRLFGESPAAMPSFSLVSQPGQQTVYLLRGGKAVPVFVRLGAADEAYVEVSGDSIAEGDLVITGLNRPARQE